MGMKFGVQASQAQIEWDEYLSLCQWIDRESNFESLWLADHFVTGFGTAFASEGSYLEAWTTLAAVAQADFPCRGDLREIPHAPPQLVEDHRWPPGPEAQAPSAMKPPSTQR